MADTELPHTWIDSDGAGLRVTLNALWMAPEGADFDDPNEDAEILGVDMPTGDDLVKLTRVLLAADGDTGHVVISTDDLDARESVASQDGRAIGARSMRERAIEATRSITRWDMHPDTQAACAEAIARLPLLADAEGTKPHQSITADQLPHLSDCDHDERWCYCDDSDHAGHPCHCSEELLRLGRERKAVLSWDEHEAILARVAPAEATGTDTYIRVLEQQRADLRRALAAATSPTLVHVATPEGITPCGEGHHDVTIDARIDQATCLDCLRALAQAPHCDEAPDIGLAERVAHLEASRADEAHGMATTLRGIADGTLKRVGALEEQVGPEMWSDLAAPGGYVCAAPDPGGERNICGLPVESEPCREHSLPGRLAATEGRVTDLEEALEEAVGLMAAYQDDAATLQRRVAALEIAQRESVQSGGAPRAQVTGAGFGVEDDTDAGDCPTCGRSPADQEQGPDGACRHTPATRLGRPARRYAEDGDH